MTDEQPLSRLQLDILELEAASWRQDGAKQTEFRRRHPHVTPTAYTVALRRLLGDPRAYECDDGRYAATLNRINRLHLQRLTERGADLDVPDT